MFTSISIIWYIQDKSARKEWVEQTISGTINHVFEPSNDKVVYLKIDSTWYCLFQDNNLNFSNWQNKQIKKVEGENGVWIKFDSNFTFINVVGNKVDRISHPYYERLNNYIKQKEIN